MGQNVPNKCKIFNSKAKDFATPLESSSYNTNLELSAELVKEQRMVFGTKWGLSQTINRIQVWKWRPSV